MDTSYGATGGRLRIGELAELAVTTTRAIRHYHAIGLLPEPARDDSGYRRYGGAELVRLVRIRRLRALGMPLDQIAAAMQSEAAGAGGLPVQLRALADDLARQIDELTALRARVLELATANTFQEPLETWRNALRRRGILPHGTELPPTEHHAVELLDALHPDGIDGVIAHTSELMTEPSLVERLRPLLARFQALPDDADDALVDALAADYVAAIPPLELRPPGIAVETMDRLMVGRLSASKLRFVRRVRDLFEARHR